LPPARAALAAAPRAAEPSVREVQGRRGLVSLPQEV
jgi:hypothetical protein